MKSERRALALKAHRLAVKHITGKEAAVRLKVSPEAARDLEVQGRMIVQAEALRLTANERFVMKALARIHARYIALGHAGWPPLQEVDFAQHRRSGFTNKTIQARLLQLEWSEEADRAGRLDFITRSTNGRNIALTAAGWAFVWATRLIKPNWKVPR